MQHGTKYKYCDLKEFDTFSCSKCHTEQVHSLTEAWGRGMWSGENGRNIEKEQTARGSVGEREERAD